MSTRFVRLEVRNGKLAGLLIDGPYCIPIDVVVPEETKAALPDLLGLVKEKPVKQTPAGKAPAPEKAGEPAKRPALTCSSCGAAITAGVLNYSLNRYGRALCMRCQRLVGENPLAVEHGGMLAMKTSGTCPVCGGKLTWKEVDFCRRHGLPVMCYTCQRKAAAAGSSPATSGPKTPAPSEFVEVTVSEDTVF